MKILFLDFDGVLNTDRYQAVLHSQALPTSDEFGALFDPDAVASLRAIIDAVPDLKIVIESSWKALGINTMRRMWEVRSLPGEVYDISPHIDNDELLLSVDLDDPEAFSKLEGLGKGGEIQAWMDAHHEEVEAYVIVDDVDEFQGELGDHLVVTDPREGLTNSKAIEAVRRLKGVSKGQEKAKKDEKQSYQVAGETPERHSF